MPRSASSLRPRTSKFPQHGAVGKAREDAFAAANVSFMRFWLSSFAARFDLEIGAELKEGARQQKVMDRKERAKGIEIGEDRRKHVHHSPEWNQALIGWQERKNRITRSNLVSLSILTSRGSRSSRGKRVAAEPEDACSSRKIIVTSWVGKLLKTSMTNHDFR